MACDEKRDCYLCRNGVASLKLRRGQKENSCVCVINKGEVRAQGGETSCPGLAVCPGTGQGPEPGPAPLTLVHTRAVNEHLSCLPEPLS